MRKFLLLFFLFLIQKVYSQDSEFSQYYANPLYLNPAFAGTEEYARVNLNYRTLLPSSFGDYSTYSASIDKYFDFVNGGLGFQIINDKQAQGIINDMGFNLCYSYHGTINKEWSIATGFKVGYNIKTINGSNLIYPEMIDPVGGVSPTGTESIYQRSMYFDFSFGMITWYDNYYAGISIDHLTKPIAAAGNEITDPINRKYTLHAGMRIPFFNTIYRENMSLSPNIIFQMQGPSSKINLGLYLNRNYLTAGAWLKTNTNFNLTGCVLMVGYVADVFTLAYSYDVPFYINGINNLNSGGHEVTFLYNFMYKSKRKKIRAIKCPKI